MIIVIHTLLCKLYDFSGKKIRSLIFMCLIGCVSTDKPSLLSNVALLSVDQQIIISAPSGFCIDQELVNSSNGSTTLFVIDCIKVKTSAGLITRRRPVSAILTATVIDIQSSEIMSIDRLEKLLTKKPGINLLSRTDTNAILKVHKVDRKNDLVLFLIEQRGPNVDFKQSDYFWRGFSIIDGKLISMTASNFSDSPDSIKKLKKLLEEFVTATRSSNLT